MALIRFQLGHVLSDMEMGIVFAILSEWKMFQLGHVLSDMEIWITRMIYLMMRIKFQLGHVLSDMEILAQRASTKT